MSPLKKSSIVLAAAGLLFVGLKAPAFFSSSHSADRDAGSSNPSRPPSTDPPAQRLTQERLTNDLNRATQKLALARNKYDQAKAQYALAENNAALAEAAWEAEQARYRAEDSYAQNMSGTWGAIGGSPGGLAPQPLNHSFQIHAMQKQLELRNAAAVFNAEKGNLAAAEDTYRTEVAEAERVFRESTYTGLNP
jgi:hypothetical protein